MEHFVEYENYCKTCKHRDLEEAADVCNDCLNYPVNEDSRKPVHYKLHKPYAAASSRKKKKYGDGYFI